MAAKPKPPAKSATGGAKPATVATKPAKLARRAKPKSPAEWAYDRIVLYIRAFEKELDADQEVAIGFAGSEAGILRIEGLGFFDPDILTFYGTDDDGLKNQLIQHVSQLSVMLQARPKADPNDAPRRIGFNLNSGWSGGESGDGSV